MRVWSILSRPVLSTSVTAPAGTLMSSRVDSKPCRPCSVRCPGMGGIVPTLQCRKCLCLYHKECAGFGGRGEAMDYTCKNCLVSSGEKNGTAVAEERQDHQQRQEQQPQAQAPRFVKMVGEGQSVVGSVTTWLPAGSTIKVDQGGEVPDGPPPRPQEIAIIGSRKFIVIPKHNILSVSPTVGAAASTPAPLPVSDSRLPESPGPVSASLPSRAEDKSESPNESPTSGRQKRAQRKTSAGNASTVQLGSSPVTRKADDEMENAFMKNYLQNLSYGYQTLLYVFQYLKVQDLLKAGCVCTLWRDIAAHPSLWRTVRMKNSQVSDWKGLAAALQNHGTETLDLRKMLFPSPGDDIWPLFNEAIARVSSLVRIELCRCPASVVEKLAETNPNLQVINAVTIRCEKMDLGPLNNLKCLTELRLKSTNGFALTSDLTPLKSLVDLRHLSLTSVKDLHKLNVDVIGSLNKLESLDLGECSDFPDRFGTDVLSKLTRLERLRLEKGQGTCCTFDILDAVSKIPTLEQLELVNFDVKSGFDRALGACANIKKLLVIPTYISQSATTNHMVLGGVIKLKSTLSHFVWGVTLELLRVTELFVDQCEDAPAKDKKKPTGNGDSIPVLKPVPIIKPGEEDGTAPPPPPSDAPPRDPPQVEILPLPTLQKLLLNCLPTTRVKILKIPFHATWRQSIVDTVN